jgi:hypothetical protein
MINRSVHPKIEKIINFNRLEANHKPIRNESHHDISVDSLVVTGEEPLKIYSIYAPVEHPFGAIHNTYEEGVKTANHHHQ